jgi:hypothetical protein
MVLSLDELTARLVSGTIPGDTLPTEALWIRFVPDRQTHKTVEYRTSDENVIVHLHLDKNEALCGIEIFP